MNRPQQGKRPHLRADTARVLFAILEEGQSSRDVLARLQAKHSDKDRAWMQEVAFGVMRQLPLLQYWLRKLLDKPLKGRQKILEHVIMLGFYQIAFTRVSEHAAVSETVSAVPQLGSANLKGLVNAILRTFIRDDVASAKPDDVQILSGLPKWLFKQLQSHYPQQLPGLVEAMQDKAPLWLRVNSRQISREDYVNLLPADFKDSATLPATHQDAIVLARSTDVTQLPGYEEGLFAVQDGAAQLAADYLNAQAGERVLDCCAAPGGKTCHILEREPDLTQCIALDVDQQRLKRVSENLTRLNLDATLVCGDASTPDDWWDGQAFDRILLDAPCSATGVIRRHPDIKWLRKRTDIDNLVVLQEQILEKMWTLLAPGGTLLYATCSILPQENTQQIARFLSRHSEASMVPVSDNESPDNPGRQILPGELQMDGFYYARLLKSEN